VAGSDLRAIVEALLFASDSPLSLSLLAETTGADPLEVAQAANELRDLYDAGGHGVQVGEMAGGYLITTREPMAPWIRKLLQGKRKARLSRAALETLAIIVYKQPVTRPEIESIRGVDSGSALTTLLERDLITIRGRSDVVGRPLLYGSTAEFLSYFGLRDLSELPRPEELKAILQAREAEAEADLFAGVPEPPAVAPDAGVAPEAGAAPDAGAAPVADPARPEPAAAADEGPSAGS
jgi:segregation and condensation protein B